MNAFQCVVCLSGLICTCCWKLSVGTELCTLIQVVGLSVLNWTHWCVLSICFHCTVHNSVCMLSVGTQRYIFPLCGLRVLKCTYRGVWFIYMYWIVHIAVCSLSVGTELYKLLFLVYLTVLKWTNFFVWSSSWYWNEHIAVCCLSLGTDLYVLLCVISVVTDLHLLLCFVSLLVLKCTHCSLWTLSVYLTENFDVCVSCGYWNVHFAV